MKILIIKNNITDTVTLESGLVLVKQGLASINFPITLGEFVLDKQLTSLPFSNSTNAHGYYVDPLSFTGPWDIGYDSVCLIYDWSKISPQPTNPMDNGPSMQIPSEWYVTYPNVFRDFFLHELCHLMANKNGVKDLTHLLVDMTLDPVLYAQFATKQPSDWYLYYLSTLIKTPMPTYKYFKPEEVIGLQVPLVQLLDQARGIAGIPFKITSGLRTPQENTLADGVQDSTHLTGNAVDVACSDSQSRLKMVSALIKVGFSRIGIYLDHIHCDNSSTHPQNVMWVLDKE